MEGSRPPDPLPYAGQGCFERPIRVKLKPVQRYKQSPHINIDPDGLSVVACRAGTMVQKFVDALYKGATWDELQAIAIRGDGTPWDDTAISSLLYGDLRAKGYGVRTMLDSGLYYQLVIPDV